MAASAVVASVAPPTEATFSRKREAAITKAVAGSASKRARVAPAMNWVQEAGDPEVAPAPACVADIAKRVVQQASKSAASVAAKREVHVVRSIAQASVAAEAQPLDAGILLARQMDGAAIQKAQRFGFKLIHDPVEFVSMVGNRPRSNLKAHVVLAPVAIEGESDYVVCAHIAAAIMGAWYTDAKSFCVLDGRSCGCQYKERCRTPRCTFKLAASADLQAQCLSLMLLLRAVAQVPGSTFELHSAENLIKIDAKQQKKKQRAKKKLDTVASNWAVLSMASEKANAPKDIKMLLAWFVPAFVRLVGQVNQEAICHGYKEL